MLPESRLKQFFLGILLSILIFVPTVSFAQNKLDLKSSDQILGQIAEPTGLSQEDLSSQSGVLIQRVLGIMGILFFGLAVYAGIIWMLARGNETEAERAQNTLIGAVIGLVVVVSAYSVTNLLLTRLNSTVEGTASSNSDIGDGPPGCCLDRVNAGWACRITTNSDCTRRGTLCEAGDDFCGNADYEFRAEITEIPACVAICEARE